MSSDNRFEYSSWIDLGLLIGERFCKIAGQIQIQNGVVMCQPSTVECYILDVPAMAEINITPLLSSDGTRTMATNLEEQAEKDLSRFQPKQGEQMAIQETHCILQNNGGIWNQLTTNGHKSINVGMVESGSQHVAIYFPVPAKNIITSHVHTDHVTTLQGKSGNQYTMTLDKIVIKFTKPGPDGSRTFATTPEMVGAKLTVSVVYEV